MRGWGRGALMVAVVLAAAPARAQTDRQMRAFIGATFAGDSTFVDLTKENAPSHAHATVGVQAAWLGDIVGVDVDFAHTPGFFTGGQANLVVSSSVTTLTGGLVIATPRRFSEYALRLYFVGGGGIMLVRENSPPVFDISEGVPAVDLGVGALGFLTNKVGLSWELRRFQRVGGPPPLKGNTVAPEHLSFWRAHMAVVIRY